MARAQSPDGGAPDLRPLVWLHGEVKTPPFSAEARLEAGVLLRLLQQGRRLEMPQSEWLPAVGKRCGALRIRDRQHNWRIVYRVDHDAVLILEVYAKKTRAIPKEIIDRCRDRLKRYDEAVQAAQKQPSKRGQGDGRGKTRGN
ncbi:type II toxin-antitoxin system RelE/ParE family toxin [Thermopirellula anaerolimosa]